VSPYGGVVYAIARIAEAAVGLLIAVLMALLRAVARTMLDTRTGPFGCIVNALVVVIVLGAILHGCGS
jgi:hypothetical protein